MTEERLREALYAINRALPWEKITDENDPEYPLYFEMVKCRDAIWKVIGD